MQFKISKLKGGKAMRTHEIVGEADYPEVGKSFVLCGKPLNPKTNTIGLMGGMIHLEVPETFPSDIRMMRTSPIVEISHLPDSQGLILHTQSGSQYLLEAM